MNRIHIIALRLIISSLVVCFATTTFAQTPTPSPAQEPAKPVAAQTPADPFAPEPPTPLPAGMTGSDVNDPRAKLKAGMDDAGEAAVGIKHLYLLKKPDAFQLGSEDPKDVGPDGRQR